MSSRMHGTVETVELAQPESVVPHPPLPAEAWPESGLPDGSASWTRAGEIYREADVYPSIPAAARGLGASVKLLAPKLLPGSGAPTLVQVHGTAGPEALEALAQSIRQDLDDSTKVMVEAALPTPPIEQVDRQALTVQLNVTSRSSRSEGRWSESGGVLQMNLGGGAGRLSRSARFVEKPWVESFSAFVSARPNANYLVAESARPAVSAAEAQALARETAVEILLAQPTLRGIRSPQYKPKMTVIEGELPVHAGWVVVGGSREALRASIETQLTVHGQWGLIADQFVQRFDRPQGPVYRALLLIDARPEILDHLVVGVQGHEQAARRSWAGLILSAGGLVAATCLIYLFLNLATRGYYRPVLGVAAVAAGLTLLVALLLVA